MSSTTEAKLASLAAGQWGMLTTAQASAEGVARSTLLRREHSGALERIRTGVYRIAGTPSGPVDDIRAAWLASDPDAVARERREHPDVVVGGAAAATVHGMGDLYPSPYLLYTTTRRRTRHDDVHYSARSLPPGDVMILDGLPVTTRERTIADLLDESGADVSIVADALRDAETSGGDLDTADLIAHLQPMAKGLGYTSGIALYEKLRSLSRVDEERLRDLIAHTDIGEQMNAAVEARLREVLAPMAERMDRQMRELIEPILRSPALNVKLPTFSVPIAKVAPPRITLPPNLLPTITLPASTQAAIDRILNQTIRMPNPYASRPPHPTSENTPATADEEPDAQ